MKLLDFASVLVLTSGMLFTYAIIFFHIKLMNLYHGRTCCYLAMLMYSSQQNNHTFVKWVLLY